MTWLTWNLQTTSKRKIKPFFQAFNIFNVQSCALDLAQYISAWCGSPRVKVNPSSFVFLLNKPTQKLIFYKTCTTCTDLAVIPRNIPTSFVCFLALGFFCVLIVFFFYFIFFFSHLLLLFPGYNHQMSHGKTKQNPGYVLISGSRSSSMSSSMLW